MATEQHGQGGSPVPAPGGTPSGGGSPGAFSNPGLLAAGAAGCVAAFCALWAFRGLPLGTALFWLAPLPLFLAGLGFGLGSAVGAALLGAVLVGLFAHWAGLLIFLALFAVPVPVLLGLAMGGPGGGPGGGAGQGAGGTLRLQAPLVFLGLWPTALLAIVALWLTGEGGLEATLRRLVEGVLQRLGMPADEMVVGMVVRLNAAAFGLLGAVGMVLNGMAAQRILARRGLARAQVQDIGRLRLPGWYPLLPALAAVAFLVAPAGSDAVPFSALLLLLLPPFFLGIAGVHLRARGRSGRVPMLGVFYLLLVVFLQLMAPAMVALGLFDHFRRRQGAPTQT